ncbi:MAG: peptidase domain-containing ABC transporter [Pseudomonadota bacterium]
MKNKVPLSYQGSISECGLACLAMLFSFYGVKIDVHALRRRYPVSLQGLSFFDLHTIANDFNFFAGGYDCALSSLKAIKKPVILLWEDKHFVVLTRVSNNKYYINDPSAGRLVWSQQDFEQKYSGKLFALSPKPNTQQQDLRSQLDIKRILPDSNVLYKKLWLIFILSLGVECFINLFPFYFKHIVDNVLSDGASENIFDQNHSTLLGVLLMGYCLVVVLHNVFSYVRALTLTRFSILINKYLQTNTMSQLLHLPIAYFEQRQVGDIQSRYSSLQRIRGVLTGQIISLALDGIMGIVVLVIMLSFSIKLTLVAIIFLLLYILLRLIRYKPYREHIQQATLEQAALDSHFLETVRGITHLKLQNGMTTRHAQWRHLLTKSNDRQLKISDLETFFGNMSAMIMLLEKGVAIYLGAALVLQGYLSLGALIAFLAFKDQFVWRITSVVERITDFSLLNVSIDRLKDILCSESESIPDHDSSKTEKPLQLQAKDVGFQYSPFDPWVFRGINLRVNSGEHIAIVGRSGSGKSTFAKVLLGLLNPSEGQIQINGSEPQGFRKNISCVLQGDRLYTGTLLENITLFEDEPNREHAYECAKIAEIHDDIQHFKMGYLTLIGDMGSTLSGGQMQRVLLARALYSKPKLLLLDEATANIDKPTLARISANLKQIAITRIMLTHDPAEIRAADRVINFDE